MAPETQAASLRTTNSYPSDEISVTYVESSCVAMLVVGRRRFRLWGKLQTTCGDVQEEDLNAKTTCLGEMRLKDKRHKGTIKEPHQSMHDIIRSLHTFICSSQKKNDLP